MKLLNKILFLLFFIFVYLFFSSNFSFKFPTSKYNYFNYLAEAFLHGKVYLISRPSQVLDLSLYKGKLYLYYPPTPAIIFMPFVYFFGKNFSDVFLTALIGGISCFVFFQMLLEFRKSKILKLKIENKTIVLMSLLFAFGTNHFYVSLFGGVWWTAHIFAVFFLNCSLYSLFKFLNSKKKVFLILAAFFFSLASLSRFPVVFSLIFILGIFIKKYYLQHKADRLNLVYFFSPIIIIFSLFAIYNYLRFRSPLELGYKYFMNSKILDFNLKNFGLFNLIYLPFNLYYYLFNPYRIVQYFPFYQPYHNGNSLFLLTPITLSIFFKWKKKLKRCKKNGLFIILLSICMFFILLPALLLYGPGGPQIGYRYSLDFLPFFLIFLLFFVNNFNSKMSLILLFLSLYFGLTSFYIFNHGLIKY